MSQDRFLIILEMIAPQLQQNRENCLNINPITKFAVYLDFMRCNNFHRTCATALWARMSRSCATKCINECAALLAEMTSKVGANSINSIR